MSITLGDKTLHYETNENKYIISFITAYNEGLNAYIDIIFNKIFPLYNSRKLEYLNVCGANAEFICKNVKIDGIKFGKIIITEWVTRNRENLQIIESVYGKTILNIGATYHALVYLEITFEDKIHYVAIETTICEPYKLQFYIGTNEEEFKTIIQNRYQCSDFKISFDCEKNWIDIAYRGGKRNKTKKIKHNKTKENKNKKKKTKTKKENKSLS